MRRALPGLDPGERVHAYAPASFRGAAASSVRGSERDRIEAFEAWRAVIAPSSFPPTGPDMALGVTRDRLVVWRVTFGLSRPVEAAGAVPLRDIAQAATTRHGLVTGLAIAFVDGWIVEVEALRGRRLRKVAAAIRAALARPAAGA